jgi:hypothetical protein
VFAQRSAKRRGWQRLAGEASFFLENWDNERSNRAYRKQQARREQ